MFPDGGQARVDGRWADARPQSSSSIVTDSMHDLFARRARARPDGVDGRDDVAAGDDLAEERVLRRQARRRRAR